MIIKPIGKAEAIRSLDANSQFSIREDVITWHTTPITDAEIATEVTRLQAVYDSQLYARTRKAKYDLLNQDEMRFDDQVNGTTTWVDAINAIKVAHPKP
jgi:hypothetical protein